MRTTKQKHVAFQLTRLLIFVLGALAILLDEPVGDILGVLSLAAWLWMPRLVQIELNLIDKWSKR